MQWREGGRLPPFLVKEGFYMSVSEKRQAGRGTIYFDYDLVPTPAGTFEQLTARAFDIPGRIVEIGARFYPGEENTKKIIPVLLDAQGTPNELVETFGDKAKGQISGENDILELSVDVPFQKGDKVALFMVNDTQALVNNIYPVKVWVTYFYEAQGVK